MESQTNISSELELKKVNRKYPALLFLGALLSIAVLIGASSGKFGLPKLAPEKAEIEDLGALPLSIPEFRYGFVLDTFLTEEGTIQRNEFLAGILMKAGMSAVDVDLLARNTLEQYDARKIRVGKSHLLLKSKTTNEPLFWIYEPDIYSYVVYDLKAKDVKTFQRPVTTSVKQATGVIASSLWLTMTEAGLPFDLAAKMEDAFAWTVDFHHIQKNDRFKLIFEEKSIDGKAVGTGRILAGTFYHVNKEHHAIYFENDRHQGFYDLEARPMKKAFLKSPVKYSRISSRFNPRRFHPVLKRVRPHYGTDYAAPYGTPIYAVAAGVVTEARRKGGNGNYVKIKHDQTYQTQYLHMQKFRKGIRPGVKVSQGEVIGYVGSTGLATGPHVCFRFWKNGRQVNHMRENLPPPEPMPESDVPEFNKVRDIYKAQLDAISYPVKDSEVVVEETLNTK